MLHRPSHLRAAMGMRTNLRCLVKGSQFLEELRNCCLLKDYTPEVHDKIAEGCKSVILLRNILQRLGQEKLPSLTNSSVLGNIFYKRIITPHMKLYR